MAEAAATESFAPLPGRFFGTGFAKGRRGRRLHILHSGAAVSRPGTFAQRKLDGRAGAPRRIDRIKRIRLPKVKSAWGVCRAKCSTLPRHAQRYCIEAEMPSHIRPRKGKRAIKKSSVFWGTLLFVILPISARPLGARPKRRRPAKARCGGQSPPDSGIAAKLWGAPFEKGQKSRRAVGAAAG